MSRASYTITKVIPGATFLVDNDVGMSVTNDAEAVVAEVSKDRLDNRIFYRDTSGDWDELVHNRGTFLRFAGISPVTRNKYSSFFT